MTVGAWLVSAALASAQPAARRPGPNNILVTAPGFSIEYPKKDWTPIYGVGSSVVAVFSKNRDANVAIEQSKVERATEPNEIVELTAKLEGQQWLARGPQTPTFTQSIVDIDGIRIILIDFVQTGPQGPQRVRVYAIPRGLDMFRVICTATPASFDKHSQTFQTIALSLRPTQ